MTSPRTTRTAKPAQNVTPAPKPDEAKPKTKPESAASVASRTAPLDLAALSASVAAVKRPVRTLNRESKGPRENTVAEKWLRELEDERMGAQFSPSARALNVKLSQVPELRSRLNQAGATLKCGVGIAFGGDWSDKKVPAVLKDLKGGKYTGNESVTLLYWTQKRKEMKRKSAESSDK